MLVGYARVSTVGQSLEVQQEQLVAAGCERVFAEKRSGKSMEEREQLAQALAFLRQGDTLVVTRLDRLARSMIDLRQVVDGLAAKGVTFRCLQQGAIDTTRSDGKLLLNILASFAEFEMDIRRERQKDGIEKAKEKGVYKGRPPKLDNEKIVELHRAGVRPVDIARQLGVSRASVYRAVAAGA